MQVLKHFNTVLVPAATVSAGLTLRLVTLDSDGGPGSTLAQETIPAAVSSDGGQTFTAQPGDDLKFYTVAS